MAQEELIYINNDLRTMLIPDSFILGVQDDRLTHRIKFRLPRYYHGIDFSDGYRICVKYENALLEDDEAMIWPDDITVEETAIFFYWNPNRTAYMSDGWVNFCVTLTHVDIMHGEAEESADVLNQFSTAAHRVRVLKGVELDELIPEEIEKNIIVQAWEILTIAMERAGAAKTSEDNAKTSELNSKQSELNAAESERTAKEWELKSEAWAVGRRNDVPVSNDNETYHNSSKYWAEQSRDKTIFGNQTVYDAMNYVYPVGSIYMSTVNVDPSVIFGGSWQRIKSKFLFACEDSGNYANGKTGGETTVTLATTQIPSHSHTFTGNENTTTSVALTSNGPSNNSTGGTALTTSGARKPHDTASGLTTTAMYYGYTGGSKYDNNDHGNRDTTGYCGRLTTSKGGYWENNDTWMNDKWTSTKESYTLSSMTRPLDSSRGFLNKYMHNDGIFTSAPFVGPKAVVHSNGSGLSTYYELWLDKYTGKPRDVENHNLISTTATDGEHTHRYLRKSIGLKRYQANGTNDGLSIGVAPNFYNVDLNDPGNLDGGHSHNINHVHEYEHYHDMSHSHTVPGHCHSYEHQHYVPDHNHNMQHVHAIDHKHDMEHKHVIDSHTHTLSNHTHSINAHSHKVTPSGSISSTGGGQAHNNMPPYLCVYMWKRTALAPSWS